MPKETRSIFMMTLINGLMLLGVLFVLGFFDEDPQTHDNENVIESVNVETFEMLIENNVIEETPNNIRYDNDKLNSFIIDSDKGKVEIKVEESDSISKQEINEQYNDVVEFINDSNDSKDKRKNVKYVIAAVVFGVLISTVITVGFKMRI